MKVIQENFRYAKITEGTPAELLLVEENLKFRVPQFYFSPQYRSGNWDSYKVQPFYYKRWRKIAIGLIPRLRKIFKDNNLKFYYKKLETKKLPIKIKPDILEGIELKNFQQKIVERMLKRGKGVLYAATNSGKTEMALSFIKASRTKTMFIVHGIDSLWQTKERFEKRLGRDVGCWCGDKKEMSDIVIASSQTLIRDPARCLKLFKKFETIILDECHHLTDKLHSLLIKMDSMFSFALSGTPYKEESLQPILLESIFGKEVGRVTNQFLIDVGFSTKPIVTFHEYHYQPDDDSEYIDAYNTLITSNSRNKLIAKIAVREKKPCVILTTRLAHSKRILDSLLKTNTDLRIKLISGESKKEFRKNVGTLLRTEMVDIIIANIVFDESMDFPNIRSIINAPGGYSTIKTLQRIGRALRKGDKSVVYMHDFVDRISHYLLDHSVKRLTTLKKEGFVVKIKGERRLGLV